jgi:predicted ArsR family transcriptional regulator
MATRKWKQRFFESTRGRIVALLRGTRRTVNELAAALNLTDNAVRTHLAALERDGLVQQSGVRRGLRKPHYEYVLTPEGEYFFPKAYDLVLNQLLAVLQKRLTAEELKEALREVGRMLAEPYVTAAQDDQLANRVRAAVNALDALGGLAESEQQDGKFFIRGASCPLAAVVVEHPQVCSATEMLVAEVTQAVVKERCQRVAVPQCGFEITETA